MNDTEQWPKILTAKTWQKIPDSGSIRQLLEPRKQVRINSQDNALQSSSKTQQQTDIKQMNKQ